MDVGYASTLLKREYCLGSMETGSFAFVLYHILYKIVLVLFNETKVKTSIPELFFE